MFSVLGHPSCFQATLEWYGVTRLALPRSISIRGRLTFLHTHLEHAGGTRPRRLRKKNIALTRVIWGILGVNHKSIRAVGHPSTVLPLAG